MVENCSAIDEPCFAFAKMVEPYDPELHDRALSLAYVHAQSTIPACRKHHRRALDYFSLLITNAEVDECYEAYYKYVNTMLMYYVYRGQRLAVDYFYSGAAAIDLKNLRGQIDQEFIKLLQSERAAALRISARTDVARAGELTNPLLDREYRKYYTRARLYARHLCVLAGFEQQYTAMCPSFTDVRFVKAIHDTLSVPPRGCRDSDIDQQIYALLALSKRGRPKSSISEGEGSSDG